MTQALRAHCSSFRLKAEEDVQYVEVDGSIDFKSTLMSQAFDRVVEEKLKGSRRLRKATSSTTSSTPTASSGSTLATTRVQLNRAGFLRPDATMFIHCRCGASDCEHEDAAFAFEAKAYMNARTVRRAMERLDVGLVLQRCWAAVESELGPVPCSFEEAASSAFHGAQAINRLLHPRLLSSIVGLRWPSSLAAPELPPGCDARPLRSVFHYEEVRPSAHKRGEWLQSFTEKDADLKTRVALAQLIAYALVLSESANGQHHAALVGTRLLRVLTRTPGVVAVELTRWGREEGDVAVRELLQSVRHENLPWGLLRGNEPDAERSLDETAVQAYLDHLACAVYARSSVSGQDPAAPLQKTSPVEAGDVQQTWGTATSAHTSDFAADARDRYAVVAAARPDQAAAARRLIAGDASLSPSCRPAPDQRRSNDDDDEEPRSGGGGGASAGSDPGQARHGRSGTSAPTSTSRAAQGSRSMNAGNSGTSSYSYGLLGLSVDDQIDGLRAIDISGQITREDVDVMNDDNSALPLGAEAATIRVSRLGEGSVEPEVDPSPTAWEELRSALETDARDGDARAVRQWLDRGENQVAALEIYLDALELTGVRIQVVSTASMNTMLLSFARPASSNVEPETQARPASTDPTSTQASELPSRGFPSALSASSIPALTTSDTSGSPSPALRTTPLPTVELPEVEPHAAKNRNRDADVAPWEVL